MDALTAMKMAREALHPLAKMDERSRAIGALDAAIQQAERAEQITEDDLRAMLPEPVATIGTDGHPRHVHHVWGVLEERHYGPPAPLFHEQQMLDYGRAVAQKCGGMK